MPFFDRRSLRPGLVRLIPALMIVVLAAAFSLDGIGAQGMNDMPGMGKETGGPTGARQAVATGTVTAVNAPSHKITLDHGPIADISWPAMKMEFSVTPSVDLAKIKAGDRVQFSLTGSGGSYIVQSINPVQ